MITEWFIGIGKTLALWVLSLFPTGWEVPSWLTTASDWLAGIVVQGQNLGAWIPWALMLTVLASTIALWGGGLLLKFVRWLVGWIPTMGGS